MLASVGGDVARWALFVAVVPLILGFWYRLLSGLGASGGLRRDPVGFREQGETLADPRFGSMHRTIKWAVAICMLALIAECTFILPYIMIRFGWSRS